MPKPRGFMEHGRELPSKRDAKERIKDYRELFTFAKKNKLMLSIQGIYDGKTIQPLGEMPKNKKYKVVITFIEEIDYTEQLRYFTAQTDAFDFWEDPREDIYQDYLPKNKK